MMKRALQLLVPTLATLLVACGDAPPDSVWSNNAGAPTAPVAVGVVTDGITLTSSTKERVTGVYVDPTGAITIKFDVAKVGDDVFADVTGNADRPIIHIETVGEDYNFSYLGGGLTLHTTKSFIAQARAQAETEPNAVSTAGFAFTGDTHLLDDMLKLPEIAQLPVLSRALGVRGITGSDFPASLVLHKMGRQSADALGINLPSLDLPATATTGYCQTYPNRGDSCYGMCGPGCSCWSWVCGNCCYHGGCAVHDSWCRQGKWWYCYDITAVIALFGC